MYWFNNPEFDWLQQGQLDEWLHLDHSCLSLGHSCLSLGHSCLSLGHLCLSLGHSCLSLGRSCLSLGQSCLSVTRVCLSVTRICHSVTLVGFSRFYSKRVRCTVPSWRRSSGAEPQGTSRPPGTPSLAICRTCWLPRRGRNKATGLQICRRIQTHRAVLLDPLHTRTRMRTRHSYSS